MGWPTHPAAPVHRSNDAEIFQRWRNRASKLIDYDAYMRAPIRRPATNYLLIELLDSAKKNDRLAATQHRRTRTPSLPSSAEHAATETR